MLSTLENKIAILDFGDYVIYTSHFDLTQTFICLLAKSDCKITDDSTELKTENIVYFSEKTSPQELYIEYQALIEYLIKSDGIFMESDYFKHMKVIQERSILSKNHSKKASSQAITYAELNDFKGVMDMISEGADINYTKILIGSFKGYSILDFAIHHGHTDIIDELLEKSATKTSEAAWSKAYILRKDMDLIINKIINNEMVLEHNLDSILRVAYQNRDYNAIELLIDIDGHIYEEELLATTISNTIHSNELIITTKLLELGILPTKRDICYAIKEGMMGFVSVLFNEIEYPVNSDRDMMLAAAASIRGAEMINILLNVGDYDLSLNLNGKSPLSVSAHLGRPEAFSILAKTFPDDMDVENEDGFTPLTLAIKRNYPDMIKEVMLFNPDINKVNIRGESPIFIAALNSTREVLVMLLDNGADPNHKNEKGTTPLMALALTREIEAIHTLLENGGDPDITNNNGLNTLTASIVQKYDVPSIVELILGYGCDANSSVTINSNVMTIKALAERKSKHQSLIVLNRPKFNKG